MPLPKPKLDASKHASCHHCHQPMALLRHEVKGTPYHGKCWMLVNRRAWRAADPDKRRAIEARMPDAT